MSTAHLSLPLRLLLLLLLPQCLLPRLLQLLLLLPCLHVPSQRHSTHRSTHRLRPQVWMTSGDGSCTARGRLCRTTLNKAKTIIFGAVKQRNTAAKH